MLTLLSPAVAEIEIRKSRFIGQIYPAASRADAMRLLCAVRAEHPAAHHVCWVLLTAGASGMDDDGEPGGTAARPIYNVLRHRQLENVLAVVVRYYGGVRLGAGGLVRAYTQAAVAALDGAVLQPVVTQSDVLVHCPFASESRLRHWCERHAVALVVVDYGDDVLLRLTLADQERSERLASLRAALGSALRVLDDA